MGLDKVPGVIAGSLLGLIFFLFTFGVYILQPQNIMWLLPSLNHDSIQHFVGWEFFRNEPWHFPLGLIKNYGYPVSTSVVYTDSIPLLALFFKFFANFLPQTFQYYGLWFAMSLCLQGVFGWLVASLFTKKVFNKVCITIFFLLSPIMLNRMVEHQALVAHWLLLAGLWLYLKPYDAKVNWSWLLLNTLAVLIHAYLALMVLMIWAAYLIRQIIIDKNLSSTQGLQFIALNVSVLGVVAWISGYFVISISSIMDAGGYSMNSMNLVGPFRPTSGSLLTTQSWSRFFVPFTPAFVEQGSEGFNYLGLGLICLLICSIFVKAKYTLSGMYPLFAVCFFMSLYAISNVVCVGKSHFLMYSLPQFAHVLTDMFRASGRFFWPTYYLLMIIVFFRITHGLKKYWASVILIITLGIQIVDISPKLIEIRHILNITSTQQNITDIAALKNAGPSYSHIVFLPAIKNPHITITNFGDYIHYAATHHLSVNVGYFARQDNKEYLKLSRQLLIDAAQGKFQNNTIYIILDRHLANKIKSHAGLSGRYNNLGEYSVIFPSAPRATGERQG